MVIPGEKYYLSSPRFAPFFFLWFFIIFDIRASAVHNLIACWIAYWDAQVEIVMGLEEEFDISVEEESSQYITTIQEAADMIDKLVQKKGEAA